MNDQIREEARKPFLEAFEDDAEKAFRDDAVIATNLGTADEDDELSDVIREIGITPHDDALFDKA